MFYKSAKAAPKSGKGTSPEPLLKISYNAKSNPITSEIKNNWISSREKPLK